MKVINPTYNKTEEILSEVNNEKDNLKEILVVAKDRNDETIIHIFTSEQQLTDAIGMLELAKIQLYVDSQG